MTARLDHMIVMARDKQVSASFLAELLGLAPPVQVSKFVAVKLAHDLSLDFASTTGEIVPQHYAFSVSEPEFDQILARIHARQLPYWADPQRTRPGEVADRSPGRAVYFQDPGGHWLEVLTR